MSNFDLKSKLINEIAAIKSLNDSFPTLNKGVSLPSLNNLNNPLDFLLDLLKNLIGFEQLKDEVIRFITYNIQPLEATLKKFLKELIKSKFFCSIDAKIPDSLIDTYGNGFNIAVSQIDFFDLFKIDPNSVQGDLLYGNIEKDLNRFIYDVIQGNIGTWKGLVKLEFRQSGVVDGTMRYNVINVKIDASWKDKTINDFLNKFIESIVLLTIPFFINKVFDNLWGTISLLAGRSSKSIERETNLETLVNKIIDLPDIEIDDSYFEFDKDDIDYFNRRVEERSSGRLLLKACEFIASSLNDNDITELNDQINNASTLVEIRDTISRSFDILTSQAVDGLSEEDKPTGILNIFLEIFKGIIRGLINILFSPKIIFLLLTYFKFVNLTNSFKNFNEFFEENRQFVIDLIRNVVLPQIIDFLLNIVIKYLIQLVIEDQTGRFLEMIKNQKLQILSLIGIPDEIRDLIAQL